MKRVFTNSSVVPCDLVKSVLDSEGIFATIRNELGSAASGCSLPVVDNPSLPWAWPEVWVSDEDYDRASALIAARENSPVTETGGQDDPPNPVQP